MTGTSESVHHPHGEDAQVSVTRQEFDRQTQHFEGRLNREIMALEQRLEGTFARMLDERFPAVGNGNHQQNPTAPLADDTEGGALPGVARGRGALGEDGRPFRGRGARGRGLGPRGHDIGDYYDGGDEARDALDPL